MNIYPFIIRFFYRIGFRHLALLLLSELRRRFFSEERYYGFYFPFSQEIQVDDPPFHLHIRKIMPQDLPILFYKANQGLSIYEIRERLQRLLFLRADVSKCFVASGPDSLPYAICWLLTHEENHLLKSYFKGNIPLLKRDEVLLEFVYVHPQYRGKKLMEWISKKLFQRAKLEGANRAIAYVKGENRTSLKASGSIGWRPFVEKRVVWKFFKRQIAYKSITG